MKHVAFVCFNHSDVFSGGRMHALYLAMAFSHIGYKVDFYTNAKPIFYDDIAGAFGFPDINMIVNKLFLWKIREKSYDHIVFVPHVVRKKIADIADKTAIYPFVMRLKKQFGGKLWLLDFESPTWKAMVDNTVIEGYKNVFALAKNIDVILSTTKTGSNYARDCYGINKDYKQLYLAVNSKVAEEVGYNHQRKNQGVIFFRAGQMHKNNNAIFNVIKSLPCGFTLLLIGKRGNDVEFLTEMDRLAKENEVNIEFHSNISEREKYLLMAEAKVLFFYSSFEGYGLPPIEAQYVGTPVICSELPVLKECNRLATFVDFSDEERVIQAIQRVLSSPPSPKSLHDEVASFASISSFCENLEKILAND